jgi:hypothetical protein
MCEACGTIGDRRGACKVLMERPEDKRPLGRCRLSFEDNIKMVLQQVGCRGMN